VEKEESESVLPEQSSSKDLDHIRAKYKELEQLVKDKDEQLKAVSNNQTILHTSLRSALSQKVKEMEELKTSKEKHATLASNVIEKLIRSDNAREMNELRHKLASDGARLGRVVHTRTGMRVHENWEDGSASKLLHKRQADLKAKRATLESRQEAARRASEERLQEGVEDNKRASALEVMEQIESVRLHLDSVRRQEAELAEEEQALFDEKTAHIRSLKLVASEDASRFRLRPKVNCVLDVWSCFCRAAS
jgi:tousled-like kinase